VISCFFQILFFQNLLSKFNLYRYALVSSLQDVSVYVSQDGHDVGVAGVAAAAETRGLGRPKTRGYTHWQRERIPLLGRNQNGHAWLAQHYKWVGLS
jgi:hypothetical protein